MQKVYIKFFLLPNYTQWCDCDVTDKGSLYHRVKIVRKSNNQQKYSYRSSLFHGQIMAQQENRRRGWNNWNAIRWKWIWISL